MTIHDRAGTHAFCACGENVTEIYTESGSLYEIADGHVRRQNEDAVKRGDGEWQRLVTQFPTTPTVGYPLELVMESLARYGADDSGATGGETSNVTTRRTSRVTRVLTQNDFAYIPDWQLDDLATALEPADMLRMCTPGGYPMFAHEDVQYVAKKQAR